MTSPTIKKYYNESNVYESKKAALIELYNNYQNSDNPKKELLEAIKKQLDEHIKNKPISDTEQIQPAIELLKNPQLLKLINIELGKKIVGEENNRLAIFLICCGKYVSNAAIASYNLCINSNSGAGKDFTAKKVLAIFPQHEVLMRSRISPAAFTYWHSTIKEPEWSWDGKIVLLSDISDSILNSDTFKVMCSDGSHSTIVVDHKAVDIEIIGKPVMLITMAAATPNNEMIRRFPTLELDESKEQTIEIKKRQAISACLGVKDEFDYNITLALSKLERVEVKVLFAPNLVKYFPDHIIMRTHFQRLLDFIKASAALHQFQRKKDDEGFILAEPIDYDNARIALEATNSNPMMIPLTKKQKMLLEECKKLETFTVKQLISHVPFMNQSKVYTNLNLLQEYGFLSSENIQDDLNTKKSFRQYTYCAFEKLLIPSWADIKNQLRTIDDLQKKGNEGK